MFKSYVEIKKNNDNLFPIMPSTIGVYHNQGEMKRPNGFDFHQFLWIYKGECEVKIPGEKRILKEGQCFFSRKNAPHSYKSTGGELLTGWVSFSGGEDILKAFEVGDYLFFDMPDFRHIIFYMPKIRHIIFDICHFGVVFWLFLENLLLSGDLKTVLYERNEEKAFDKM